MTSPRTRSTQRDSAPKSSPCYYRFLPGNWSPLTILAGLSRGPILDPDSCWPPLVLPKAILLKSNFRFTATLRRRCSGFPCVPPPLTSLIINIPHYNGTIVPTEELHGHITTTPLTGTLGTLGSHTQRGFRQLIMTYDVSVFRRPH